MIWIIAGTSEARDIIDRIKDLDSYVVTVATEGGKEFISSENIVVGRMDYSEMKSFVRKNEISLIVDLSHPYAKIVSNNAKKLGEDENIKYIRYIREKTIENSNSIYLKSFEEAYAYISHINGTVFFTTGSKNIGEFEKVRGENRFIYRVLPALESIKQCSDHKVPMKNIIAILGPLSIEYNKIMFCEYKADYVIMKDSGAKAGTIEKIKACQELGIPSIVIGREDEVGINNLDEIEEVIRENT